jgi:hypothetical protein
VLQWFKLGQTSIIIRCVIRNKTLTTGDGLTGLTNSSAGLRIAAIADNEAVTTAYTQAGATIQTVGTLGTFLAPAANNCRFAEVDAVNHPGLYEIQLDNTRYAVANSRSLTVSVSGATNAAQVNFTIPLTQMDPYTATVTVGATGLDGITTEGNNLRQTICLMADALFGVVSGAAGTTVTIKDPTGASTRITATVDSSGNRSALTLAPPP